MIHTDYQIICRIWERMTIRRNKEKAHKPDRRNFTMSYAVSVVTGRCYVGYNMEELNKTRWGTGTCAENRAECVAKYHDETPKNLVFFAVNNNSELFNPCSECQKWLIHRRGFLKNQNQVWGISTRHKMDSRTGEWTNSPLTARERATLYWSGSEFEERPNFEVTRTGHGYFRRLYT